MRRRSLLLAFAAATCAARTSAAADAPILVVATSTATAGAGGRRTGLDLATFAEAYWLLREAGRAVELATVAGGPPPIDPASGSLAVLPMALRMDPDALRAFAKPRPVGTDPAERYGGLLLAGGLGALWDFPSSVGLGRVAAALLSAGRPVAAFDHGVAGLLAPGPDGRPLAAGRRVTGPTDAEARALGRRDLAPFSLEARLREAGAAFEAKGVLLEGIVRDGGLITGQNATSAGATARLLAEAAGAPPGVPG